MINTDTPIQKSEDDLLNRSEFAEQLAKAILEYNQEESFNIGLYGKWGSGKTSIINMTTEKINQLSEENKPFVLRFNPWLFSNEMQLVQQFFKQLSEIVGESKSSTAKKLSKGLEKFGDLLTVGSVVDARFGIIGQSFSWAGKIIKKVTKENLQKKKNEIREDLKELNSKLIIIIDDIDRLPDNEIRVIFQLIKSVADFPNTIYLLAFDDEVTSRALDKFQDGKGKEYLEKIVQIPIQVPLITKDRLKKIFVNGLDDKIGKISVEKCDQARWNYLLDDGIIPLIKNIRDVNRLTNTISFKYNLVKDEVDPVEFFGITALEIYAPEVYHQLPRHKFIICGRFSSYSKGDPKIKEIEELVNFLLQSIPDSAVENYIKNILVWIFPKIRASQTVRGYVYEANIKPLAQGNIWHERYFDRYFVLSLKESLSLKEAKYIIIEASREEIGSLICNFNEANRSYFFFQYLHEFLGGDEIEISISRLKILLDSITSVQAEISDVKEKYGNFSWKLGITIRFLLGKIPDQNVRFEYIKMNFKDSGISLSTKIEQLRIFEEGIGCYVEAPSNREKTVLLPKMVDQLRKICRKLVLESIQAKELIDEPAFWIIRMFQEFPKGFIEINIFNKYIEELKGKDLTLAKLVTSFVEYGHTSSLAGISKRWIVKNAKMEIYFNKIEVHSRLKKWICENEFLELSKERQMDVIAFLYFVENEESIDIDFADGHGIMLSNIKEYAKENKIKLDN